MKLLNFYSESQEPHLGVVQGEMVFDLSEAALPNPFFASVVGWIRNGPAARQLAKRILGGAHSGHSSWRPLGSLRHAPLISRDCRIFAVGLNYADHAAENNLPLPRSPIFFEKLASITTPHNAPIPLPPCSTQVDYEAELAFLIGRRARRLSESAAVQCIAGYTIMNDVTARDLQISDGQWFRGKNCDGFAPLGPWLVTADEIPHPDDLEITLRLNGQVRQHSNTGYLVFKPSALLSFLSQTLTLEPGDVISTGTPGGVGFYGKPPTFLRTGDVVEIEVTQIGILRNAVIQSEG